MRHDGSLWVANHHYDCKPNPLIQLACYTAYHLSIHQKDYAQDSLSCWYRAN